MTPELMVNEGVQDNEIRKPQHESYIKGILRLCTTKKPVEVTSTGLLP